MEKTTPEKDSPKPAESARAKRRQPEDLGALAVVSERESQSLHEKPASGHVGAAAIRAETKPAKVAAETATKSETAPPTGKNIETMSRAELLVLSEKVMIDGTSLRQIYETHLVGEQGLRRLLAEHFRDGDLKKALRREIVERQIDFERDPALRDISVYVDPSAAQGTNGNKEALDTLLKQTDLAADSHTEETAFFKARALYEAEQLLRHKRQRQWADVAVIAVIAILVLLILILFMSRS